ncbi:MAG: hypothetical protein JST24_02350 [Acidobacteria bacterium]|nr:hypothetical protein [Acidobacteriota bacterium]
MTELGTPLVFRASSTQRVMAFLIFAGSWLAGVRAITDVVHRVPGLHFALQAARAADEPTALLWTLFLSSFLVAALAGALLLISLLFLLLVEGTQVTLDPIGIAVENFALPAPLARKLGAGRLAWKRVAALDRKGFFFVLKGNAGGPPEPGEPLDRDLRFLLVDQLERLVLMIFEKSPNLRMDE